MLGCGSVCLFDPPRMRSQPPHSFGLFPEWPHLVADGLLHVGQRGHSGIVHRPAHRAEALAFHQHPQQKAVQSLAHRRGVGTGAHHRAMVGQPLNDPRVFEKTTPRRQPAARRQRLVRARNREFARQACSKQSRPALHPPSDPQPPMLVCSSPPFLFTPSLFDHHSNCGHWDNSLYNPAGRGRYTFRGRAPARRTSCFLSGAVAAEATAAGCLGRVLFRRPCRGGETGSSLAALLARGLRASGQTASIALSGFKPTPRCRVGTSHAAENLATLCRPRGP